MALLLVTSSWAAAEEGFTPLFDGESLKGWQGRSDLWSVQEGAITGITTAEAPIKQNTFLVYQESQPTNFELRAEFRMEGGNSGIQYRSAVKDADAFVVGGYQADIDASLTFAGILYEEKGRGILAQRGQKVTITASGEKQVESFGDAKELGKVIRAGEWNSYRVVANGNHLQHFINDTLMIEVIDQQTEKAATSGVIALQIHVGPPMKVQFKNLRMKAL